MRFEEQISDVWTTEKVEQWYENYQSGVKMTDSPWLNGVIGVKKPNLPFSYTKEEIAEIVLCSEDIIYFAENYCQIMCGDLGYQPVHLREYQKRMLNAYKDNRFCITMTSRQMGKCTVGSRIKLMDAEGNVSETTIEELYYKHSEKSLLNKVKSFLLRLYDKI